MRFGILLGTMFFAAVASSYASTINFDDLVDNGFGTSITDGYQGLSWTNFGVVNAQLYTNMFGANGYASGTTSAPNVAYAQTGNPATLSSSTPFDFTSAQMGAAWYDNLNVEVDGYIGASLAYTTTLVLSASAATSEVFDWAGVTQVTFIASGGIPHSGYFAAGTQFTIDDLVLNANPVSADAAPEPGSIALLGGGLVALGLRRRRNRVR